MLGVVLCLVAIFSLVQTGIFGGFFEVLQYSSGFFEMFSETSFLFFMIGIVFLILFIFSNRKFWFVNLSIIVSLIFYIPSALPYSSLNWIDYLGLEIELGLVFEQMLVLGVVLVSGFVFLFFVARIESGMENLESRGASEEEIGKVGKKKVFHSLTLVLVSAALVVSLILSLNLFFPAFEYLVEGLASPQIIALISMVAVPVIVIIYILSETGRLSPLLDFEDEKDDLRFRGFVTPGIYETTSVGKMETNLSREFLRDMSDIGANFVLIPVVYSFDEENEEFVCQVNERELSHQIENANREGLNVYLSLFAEPFQGSGLVENDFEGVSDEDEFLDRAESIVMRWADFAEKKDVKMFGIWKGMTEWFPNEDRTEKVEKVKEWYRKVIPKARSIYSGLLATTISSEALDFTGLELDGLDYVGVEFSGYDSETPTDEVEGLKYIWKGPKNWASYEGATERLVPKLERLEDEWNLEGSFLNFVYLDLIEGERLAELQSDREVDEVLAILAKSYRILLENTVGELDGYFFFRGSASEVRDVLRSYYKKGEELEDFEDFYLDLE